MLDTVNFTSYRLKRKTPINVSNNMTDNDNTGIFHVFEMRFGMDEFDHRILALLSSSKNGLKNSGLNGDSNLDLCDAGAMFHQLRLSGQLGQIVMWFDYKPHIRL